ncbi:type I polyketide synthase [Nostoc sp. FACHB-133]|uniref:type I polyketide synthase n=1 Tax=Nostoc sp. FACHB-133 TaxID=2692835 RepID=UPI001686AA92|nr:type I polyketide synthase [Nostoc sp. FACHB-133]MBD2522077.1 type I polyketide synthase [Nostoc sp. FACHB-133]
MSKSNERVEELSPLKRALLALETMQAKLNRLESKKTEPIAIVGMGCRFPGGVNNPQSFWQCLRDGVDAMQEIPSDRWDLETYYNANADAAGKMYTRHGAFVDDVDKFDADFFSISPREAAFIDPQQRLFLEVCWEALEQSGERPDQLAGSRTGVFVGVMYADYSRLQGTVIDAYSSTGNSMSVVSGRVSYLLGLQGPSVTLDTACSSSLVAVHLACQSLRSGECNLALAGGVSLMLIPDNNITLCRTRALSPTGRCKTFDADADGFARGEGCGTIALKRLSDAIADGNPILAVIRGSAVNQDGRSNGLTAPNGPAQQAVLREALANAGVKPYQVSYVEAHGTGTPLGDPIEVSSLAAVLGEGRSPNHPLALGSVKTNIGHLESAAGVAGLIKVVLAMQHQQIPPHLHFQKLNPYISWGNLPISIPTELTPWNSGTERRIAGVSSFGFSGTNAHVILEEAPLLSTEPALVSVKDYLLPLSAKNPAALLDMVQAYRAFLPGKTNLLDIAYTTSLRRPHHKHRIALVGQSIEQLTAALDAFVEDPNLVSNPDDLSGLVFVFSGQGAQWIGMGRQLLAQEPVFRETIQECDRILKSLANWSLLQELAAPEDISRLQDTEVAQPAILAIQVALTALWRSWGIEPAAVVGHSLGEITAAYVAGVFSLEIALRIVVQRASLMQQATGKGKMAAIGMPWQELKPLLEEFPGLAIAAINSPASTVVAGDATALETLCQILQAQEIFCRLLRVNYAFHCPQMQPYSEELVNLLVGLQPQVAQLPLFSTVTGTSSQGQDWDAAYWGRNMRSPVQFSQAIENLVYEGYTYFVEVSPHPVLSQNIQECLQHTGKAGIVLASMHRERQERYFLLSELGRLYTLGYQPRWQAFYPENRRCVLLPTYPWQHQRYWLEGSNSLPPRRTSQQPLLGEALPSLAHLPEMRIWQTQLDLRSLPYLNDHRVQGVMVLPGSGYVEMVLAAATEIFGAGKHTLEVLHFQQGLFIPEAETQTLQICLQPGNTPDTLNFDCYSRPSINPETKWRHHASGTVRRGDREITPTIPATVAEIQARCQEVISGTQHYQQMAEQGLLYGASFQGVEQIWRREGEALGRIHLPASLHAEIANYQIHPVLLDACFQVIALATPLANPDAEAEGAYLPVRLDKLRLYQQPDATGLWVHLQLKAVVEIDAFAAELVLFNDQGQRILDAECLRIQKLDSQSENNSSDWFYEISWERLLEPKDTAPRRSEQNQGYWLILTDRQGIGENLSQQLQQQGENCILVFAGETYQKQDSQHYQIQPNCLDDFKQLLQTVSSECLGVVHLWSLDITPAELTTLASLAGENMGDRPLSDRNLGCISTLHLVQALAETGWQNTPRLWLVTRGVQPVDSSPSSSPSELGGVKGKGEGGKVSNPLPLTPSPFPSHHAAFWGWQTTSIAQSPLWGLGRVIAQEHPDWRCSMVDLAPVPKPSEIASLLQLLQADDVENQIALRGDVSYVARLKRYLPSYSELPNFHPEATYLIAGGLRGLGLQVATWMVERRARYLALMARSQPTPAALEVLQTLETAGAKIKVLQADISQAEEVARAIAQLDQDMPPLRGVIHSAAVLDDGILLQLTPERLHKVMQPKIEGAWNLHTHTLNKPLDFFVLFSSAASLLGSAGQGNYAAANAFLDGLAHYRQSQNLPALSINWGAWAEVGLAAAQANRGDRMASLGFSSIPPQQGLDILGHLLTDKTAQLGVIPINWAKVLRANPAVIKMPLFQLLTEVFSNSGETETDNSTNFLSRQALLATPSDERQLLLETYFHAQVARVLRMPASKLDRHQPLNSQGLDSLVAVELKNTLKNDLGIDLPMIRFIQGPSIAQLSAQVLTQITQEMSSVSSVLVSPPHLRSDSARPVELATSNQEWEDGEL